MGNVQPDRGVRGCFVPRTFMWLYVGVGLCIAGCAVGPDYERPKGDMPDAWTQSKAPNATEFQDPNELTQWWTRMNDPVLDSLMEKAVQANLDLREALFRIRESRAYRAYVSGSRLPNVDASSSYTRNRYSENGVSLGTGEDVGLYTGGFDAAWEVDLFGKIRRSVESAQASLDASVDNYYGVQVALLGEVAGAYVELRTIQLRIRYAQNNLVVQSKTLGLTRDLFAAGRVSELDVKRAESSVANTESQIPPLKASEIQAVNRLAVLLGDLPGTVGPELTAQGEIPQMSQLPMVGLPADLLRRRPDIRQAERQLAAQVAQIGVAEAERYPSFSLSGTFELQARDFADWGSWSSRAYSYGPSLRWNVFSGNRVDNNVKIQEAAAEQARARYEQAVLTAVEEVENALVARTHERDRHAALEHAVAASEQSVALVQSLYKSGLANFQDVLDVEQTLFEQQDSLAASRGQVVQNIIQLYKALGGGWTVAQDTSWETPVEASP